jgi:hypothetical protein
MAGRLSCTAIWWREKAVTAVEFIRERKRRVLIAECSDTKLRIIRRLNLLV